MTKYERELIDFRSLQEGNIFEHPVRDDTICKVEYANLQEDEGNSVKVVGYSIVEGGLHWPVLYLPPEYQVTLLLPTTTFVRMSGKDWVSSLTDQHGVKE